MSEKSIQLNDRVRELVAQLANDTDQARQDEAFKAYLRTAAKFHHYSWHNQMLIWAQCPTATMVMGFRQWNTVNRFVRKGEKGISIMAPMAFKDKKLNAQGVEEEQKRLWFRVVYVFDFAQTDGEPLPAGPAHDAIGEAGDLFSRLGAFIGSTGVTIEIGDALSQHAEGFYQDSTRHIVIGRHITNEAYKFAVLAHEGAHALLHSGAAKREKTKKQRELEAEATAFVVCAHFGIQTSARFYLAEYDVKACDLLESLPTIQQTAKRMIEAVTAIPLLPAEVAA